MARDYFDLMREALSQERLEAYRRKQEDSDIDLLIDYDLTKISAWFPGGLLMDLQDLLDRKVDIVTEQGLSHLIKDRVLAEAKSL